MKQIYYSSDEATLYSGAQWSATYRTRYRWLCWKCNSPDVWEVDGCWFPVSLLPCPFWGWHKWSRTLVIWGGGPLLLYNYDLWVVNNLQVLFSQMTFFNVFMSYPVVCPERLSKFCLCSCSKKYQSSAYVSECNLVPDGSLSFHVILIHFLKCMHSLNAC